MAKQIITKSRDFTVKELYDLTMSPKQIMVKNMKDEEDTIEVAGFLVFADNKEGEDTGSEILAIQAADGSVYVTQSETFKRSFMDILMINGNQFGFKVAKVSGKTKSGRDYVDCIMV